MYNSKWSILKRTSSKQGNMNFVETGILRWSFTFNNSLVGSNACNIAPCKLNIKVEGPIALLPILQAQYQSWMPYITIAYCLFCLLTYSLCQQYCTMQAQVLNIKVGCSIILKRMGVSDISAFCWKFSSADLLLCASSRCKPLKILTKCFLQIMIIILCFLNWPSHF